MTAAAAILRALGYAAFALELNPKNCEALAESVRQLEKASQAEGSEPLTAKELDDYRHD